MSASCHLSEFQSRHSIPSIFAAIEHSCHDPDLDLELVSSLDPRIESRPPGHTYACILVTVARLVPHSIPTQRSCTVLSIHDKPHIPRPLQGEHAHKCGDLDMNTDSESRFSPSSTQQPSHRHPCAPSDKYARLQNASSTSAACPGLPLATTSTSTSTSTTDVDSFPHDTRPASTRTSSTPKRSALPFNFPFFQLNNKSVTSLVPSTAEGKPIPLDDNTAAHRTSALRELNSNFPSVTRHKYTKSSGASSSTYSQPVIVRTYSGPSASQGHSRSNSHTARRRGPPSTTSTSVSYVSPAAHSRPAGTRQHGGLIGTVRENAQKKMPWPWLQGHHQDRGADKLPPHDAFSFKTIMANLQAQSNEMDKALDGIAEIYARSRYSLSNQYEVHVAPHGSGSSFISAVPSSSIIRRRGHARNSNSQSGPTLQAIQSDDDDNSASARSHHKRRVVGRRRSAAYGTLETIMSSSRSSEEDKSKKKSASQLTDEVRGRASPKPSRSASGSSNACDAGPSNRQKSTDHAKQVTRQRSKSFANAIIYADTTKNQVGGETVSPRTSSAALVSQPSMPQTSSSHLEIRTTSNELFGDASTQGSVPDSEGSDRTVAQFLQSLTPKDEPKATNSGLISGLGIWVPWKTASSGAATSPPGSGPANSSHAEGSLRELLKTVDDQDKKGKSVEQTE